MGNSPTVKAILVLAGSPVDRGRLRLDVKVHQIEKGLQWCKYCDQIKLQFSWVVGVWIKLSLYPGTISLDFHLWGNG